MGEALEITDEGSAFPLCVCFPVTSFVTHSDPAHESLVLFPPEHHSAAPSLALPSATSVFWASTTESIRIENLFLMALGMPPLSHG